MNDIIELITTLIDHTYDSGYYSGRGDDGKMIHARAIADRNQARNDLLVRLETDAARLAAAEWLAASVIDLLHEAAGYDASWSVPQFLADEPAIIALNRALAEWQAASPAASIIDITEQGR